MLNNNKLDLFIKAIPISIFIFLIFNFIFNLGYFWFIGIKFASLLEIRDYYEGTAPLIILSMVFIFNFINAAVYADSAKNLLIYCKTLCKLFFNFFAIKVIYRIILCMFKKLPYSYKKRTARINKRIENMEKLDYIKIAKNLCKFLYISFILISPIFLFFAFTVNFSKDIFFTLCFLYLFLIGIYLISKSSRIKIAFSIILIPCLAFTLGIWTFIRDYKTTGTKAIIDKHEYLLLRPIFKGVIIKNDQDVILFYSWDKVSALTKQTNSKLFIKENINN